MNICIISEGYPYQDHEFFTFVKQLCIAIADQGWTVSVISPVSIIKKWFNRTVSWPPICRTEYTTNGNPIDIYSPRIITIGNFQNKRFLYHLIMLYRQKAIEKVIHEMPKKPDIIYGHFWHSAYAAYPAAQKYKIPLFVASGEAEIELDRFYSSEKLSAFTDYLSGVICVSSKNKKESITKNLTTEDKCIVIPNAVDQNLFHQTDKKKSRDNLGFGQDDFIVAFVGGFIHRKGAKRVAKAIELLNKPDIKSIFIGKLLSKDTSEMPECNGILFRGSLAHNLIPDYLNCADVFVMPTLHEGCCNANIEALACGLPVISSDRDFNYDILDRECSIMVDPENISDISKAILFLYENKEIRQSMSSNAALRSKAFHINARAEKIMNFIKSQI